MNKDFSSRLNAVLDRRGYPNMNKGRQTRLAKEMGVSNKAASRWVNGEQVPSRDNMEKLCDHLGCSFDELARGITPSRPNKSELHDLVDGLTPMQQDSLKLFIRSML